MNFCIRRSSFICKNCTVTSRFGIVQLTGMAFAVGAGRIIGNGRLSTKSSKRMIRDRVSSTRIGKCQSRQPLKVAAAVAEGLDVPNTTSAPEKIRVGINGAVWRAFVRVLELECVRCLHILLFINM